MRKLEEVLCNMTEEGRYELLMELIIFKNSELLSQLPQWDEISEKFKTIVQYVLSFFNGDPDPCNRWKHCNEVGSKPTSWCNHHEIEPFEWVFDLSGIITRISVSGDNKQVEVARLTQWLASDYDIRDLIDISNKLRKSNPIIANMIIATLYGNYYDYSGMLLIPSVKEILENYDKALESFEKGDPFFIDDEDDEEKWITIEEFMKKNI